MSTSNLHKDIDAFKNLPSQRRKWVISMLYDQLYQLHISKDINGVQIIDFNVGLNALDALHHIAKSEEER